MDGAKEKEMGALKVRGGGVPSAAERGAGAGKLQLGAGAEGVATAEKAGELNDSGVGLLDEKGVVGLTGLGATAGRG